MWESRWEIHRCLFHPAGYFNLKEGYNLDTALLFLNGWKLNVDLTAKNEFHWEELIYLLFNVSFRSSGSTLAFKAFTIVIN